MYRRVLTISWTEHITNDELARRMGTGIEIVRQCKTRKLHYFWDIIHNKLQIQIIEEKIERRKSRGIPTTT